MKRHLSFVSVVALVIAGCAGSARSQDTTAASTASPPPPRLPASLTRADLDARLADHRLRLVTAERLEDAPNAPGPSRVRVNDDEIAIRMCVDQGRPAPAEPMLIADDASRLYVALPASPPTTTPPPRGDGPHFTTECSMRRYRMPMGVSYEGEVPIE